MLPKYQGSSFCQQLDRGTAKKIAYVTSDIRNHALASFLQRFLPEKSTRLAVDIGCGSGVQSWALSSFCKSVKAIDRTPEDVQLASDLAAERGIENVEYLQADAFALPCADGAADLVVLNGVLEWVGVNDDGEDPTQRQLRCLKEARRILGKNGVLYLAIENRWAPCHIRKDPHIRLPLINALPRWMADLYLTVLCGQKYQVYIHGKRQLARLLARAGFGRQEFYVPVPSYQYAFSFISLESRSCVLSQLAAVNVAELQDLSDQVALEIDMRKGLRRLRRRARFGMLPLTAANFSCIAYATS